MRDFESMKKEGSSALKVIFSGAARDFIEHRMITSEVELVKLWKLEQAKERPY